MIIAMSIVFSDISNINLEKENRKALAQQKKGNGTIGTQNPSLSWLAM